MAAEDAAEFPAEALVVTQLTPGLIFQNFGQR